MLKTGSLSTQPERRAEKRQATNMQEAMRGTNLVLLHAIFVVDKLGVGDGDTYPRTTEKSDRAPNSHRGPWLEA